MLCAGGYFERKRPQSQMVLLYGSVNSMDNVNTIEAQVVDDIVCHYYTVIYSDDENGLAWFSTGILVPSVEEALRQFQSYSNVKHFHVVRIDLKGKSVVP
jgi:hypothetical protein